jgi:hypothetical protein
VFNDRIFADAGEDQDEILLPRLAVVVVIADVSGVERIAFRQWFRHVDEPDPEAPALSFEPHNPASDEHNFVVSRSPMVFAAPGTYEVVFEVDVRDELVTFRYRFVVQRRKDTTASAQ